MKTRIAAASIVLVLGAFGVHNNLQFMLTGPALRYSALSLIGLAFGLLLIAASLGLLLRAIRRRAAR